VRHWSVDRDAGQAAVETALILLILLGLVFGIVEAARLMLAVVSVERAARAGARFAAVAQWALPEHERLPAIRNAAVQAAPALNLQPEQVGVYSSSSTTADASSTGAPGDRVRVEVTFRHHLVTPLWDSMALELVGREEACSEYVTVPASLPCGPIPTARP
jgi:Flp pilus assembly protein TadG